VLTALPLVALLFGAFQAQEPAPEFDLSVRCVAADDLTPAQAAEVLAEDQRPTGWRILRGDPELHELPLAAWMERPQIKHGKWRPWPIGQLQASVTLYPTPQVAEFDWRVVVYRKNSMTSFRIASESFRELAIGSSPAFKIPALGGQLEVEIPLQQVIQIQPRFGALAPPEGSEFRYVFSYGPPARPPRYARGNWDGVGLLPVHLSPFAVQRPGTLELTWLQLPAPLRLGPMEFRISPAITTIDYGDLPEKGALRAKLPPGPPWQLALGYINQDGEAAICDLGQSNTDGTLLVDNLRHGDYFLLATEAESKSFRRLRFDFHAKNTLVELQEQTTFEDYSCQWVGMEPDVLSQQQIKIRSLWGPFLIQVDSVQPNQPCRLPSGPDVHYQAMLQGVGEDGETTVFHYFPKCNIDSKTLQFSRPDTVLEVDGYEDGEVYTLRLLRDVHGIAFPPLHWAEQALDLLGTSYLPLTFTNTLRIHGLPESAYEGSLWGLDRDSGKIEELSYHYPIAD
jgi:hypothetical protein